MTETNGPAAISATYRAIKTMADGTPRVTLDLDCTLAVAAQVLGLPGDVVAIARLTEPAAASSILPTGADGYGEQARILKLSSFFRTPKVWEAIGTDEDFATWIQQQPCCICTGGDWIVELGELRCEAAHVRRAGESGTGYKANYARVPMCHAHHTLQHNQGEAAVLVGSRHRPEQITEVTAESWFDKQRIEYVQRWAWESLKAQLGHESWRNIPPQVLLDWAQEHGVSQYMPAGYR